MAQRLAKRHRTKAEKDSTRRTGGTLTCSSHSDDEARCCFSCGANSQSAAVNGRKTPAALPRLVVMPMASISAPAEHAVLLAARAVLTNQDHVRDRYRCAVGCRYVKA